MPETFVDNDIVFKLLRIGYLDDLAMCLGHDEAQVAVLETLRFKLAVMLKGDAPARDALNAFLARIAIPEPSDAEVLLAARLEESALKRGYAVDGGESILFAMAASQGSRIATGDKRAIAGLAAIAEEETACQALFGAFFTLEWLACALIGLRGAEPIRNAVCAHPQVDRTLHACFECYRNVCSSADIQAALSSYQRDLAEKTNGFVSPKLPLAAGS